MASLHADHVIEPASAFTRLLADAAELAAETGRLFTIGIDPTRPETGYGYIDVGDPLPGSDLGFAVRQFVEKPDRGTAEDYLARGTFLWNSGLFVWRAASLLDEVRRHTPELAQLLPLLDAGDVEGFFDAAPSLSIDEGVLERSDRVAVVRATFRWDDVGAWDAVGRTLPGDGRGNVASGDVHAVDCDRTIAWSDDGGAVVMYGVRDLVVVRTGDVTLVVPRDRSADLKRLLEELPERLREPGS